MEKWLATTAFGLESVTARELKALGACDVVPQSSRVAFSGEWDIGVRANICLRSAGHVGIVAGEFDAASFDALFEGVRDIPWEIWTDDGARVEVSARAVNSTLMSVPDIQRIVKKAVSERLMGAYGVSWLKEDGPLYPLEAHIYKDHVTLSLNTSGSPLHMRGYRKLNGPASLRETLAASLVLLTKWCGDRTLCDPFCGTGTIAVEAAMIAADIAPSMHRKFLSESWGWVDGEIFRSERERARECIHSADGEIIASDIDEESLSMAQYHAKSAGVSGAVTLRKADIRQFSNDSLSGHIITNPPYGQRLGSEEEARELTRVMGRRFATLPRWGIHILSALPSFEQDYGKRAVSKRELRNGQIQCRYFEYY